MSRIANALHMYILLQGRRLMTVQELADILEVSPRMIKSYRKDLEKVGINIRSKKGRYGGYYLENGIDLKGLGISKEELDALKMAREVIRSGNHLFASNFEILANKILNLQNDFEYVVKKLESLETCVNGTRECTIIWYDWDEIYEVKKPMIESKVFTLYKTYLQSTLLEINNDKNYYSIRRQKNKIIFSLTKEFRKVYNKTTLYNT